MTNFDFYRNNPAAAAALIAREGHCFLCPMCEQCTHEDYYICFVMWMRFFKINTEPLESVDDFSDLLSIAINCDKCGVAKENECDCIAIQDCALKLRKWLCNKFTTQRGVKQMSYDIYFKIKPADCELYVEIRHASNITWNLREMIVRSTGLEWRNEENNGLVKDVIPHIQKGLAELVNHPEKYKKYESPNGWGTIKGCKRFFSEIINAYEELPPELKKIATFWIE